MERSTTYWSFEEDDEQKDKTEILQKNAEKRVILFSSRVR